MLLRLRRASKGLQGTVRPFLLTFAVGFMLLILGLLAFSPLLSVREIRVPRTDARVDVEQVQRALAPVFRRHLLFLPVQEVIALLREAVPDLTAVTVQKRYPSILIVRLTLDPIIARLSIGEPEQSHPSASAIPRVSSARITMGDYLTAQGLYVTYTASQVRGALPPLLHIVDWGARPSPWTRLLEPNFLLAMREADQTLHGQFGQEVTEQIVFLRAREFHLRTKPVTLWFDRRNPLEEQFRRYRIFLRTVGLPAAKEYVDLRLTDRVVYK